LAQTKDQLHLWSTHSSMATTPISFTHASMTEEATIDSLSTQASMTEEATIQDSLHAAVEEAVLVVHHWDAHLSFKITSAVLCSSKDPCIFDMPLEEQDIFNVGSTVHLSGMKLCFNPTDFPFDGNFKESPATWSKPLQPLCPCSANNGFRQTRMAFLGSCFKLLCCTHWTACSDISASKSTVPSDHWESNIRSDRQSGSLPKGHNSLRQTSCSPPNCLSKVCGVKLFLGLRLLSPWWSQSEKTPIIQGPWPKLCGEITQINNLIDCMLKKTIGQQCAWHVVGRSWNRCLQGHHLAALGSGRESDDC
jgi:hypothetical protein